MLLIRMFLTFQAYHSQIRDFSQSVGNMAILPLRTQHRGPAPSTTGEDIIDESLYFFKANVFFRTYEVKASDSIVITTQVAFNCPLIPV